MGMYNWVDFEIECPNCGGKIDSFQSKPWNGKLERLDPWNVEEEFHDGCDQCGAWIEYVRKSNDWTGSDWIKDFDRKVELNG